MRLLRLGLYVAAVLWFGVMAGFFWAYSANVSLVTALLDGASYAVIQSELNRQVRHGLFFVFFFGPPLWALAAMLSTWRDWRSLSWRLLALAVVLYGLGVIAFTAQVNLPNNAYTESWLPHALPPDWERTRDAWRQANHWRVLASGASFLLACLALGLRTEPRPANFNG